MLEASKFDFFASVRKSLEDFRTCSLLRNHFPGSPLAASIVVAMLLMQRYDGINSLGKPLYLSCLAAYLSLFHSLSLETDLPTKNADVEMKVGLRIYKHANIQAGGNYQHVAALASDLKNTVRLMLFRRLEALKTKSPGINSCVCKGVLLYCDEILIFRSL
jgi:hypothetical protein